MFLLNSEVENDPQTCPLFYLISLDTFYFKILLLEWVILVTIAAWKKVLKHAGVVHNIKSQ